MVRFENSLLREPNDDRFISRDSAIALLEQAHKVAVGGGTTRLSLESRWSGNLRWAQNQVWTSGDIRNNDLWLTRSIRGASAQVTFNQVDDTSVLTAVRRAERFLLLSDEIGEDISARTAETHTHPQIWSDATYALDARHRAAVVERVVRPAKNEQVIASGYLQVAGQGRTVLDTDGNMMYYPYTTAQYSITVRDPKARGSGWAGVDHHDWTKIDPAALSAVALDKCLRSRNPVALEPGRYTAILEAQAVCDLCSIIFTPRNLSRVRAEKQGAGPFAAPRKNFSKIGERVIDERITITADPMDSDMGFVPFDRSGAAYHRAVWFEDGVLRNLAYDRKYAISELGKDTGLPTNGAFHMSGGTTTVDEMIASTRRGVLVTRFSNVEVIDDASLLSVGYTRDGLWLIENGKTSKPVKNFRFSDSPLFVLSNIEALGTPQRVFHPGAPVIVPPIKVRDFNFAGLSDAI